MDILLIDLQSKKLQEKPLLTAVHSNYEEEVNSGTFVSNVSLQEFVPELKTSEDID